MKTSREDIIARSFPVFLVKGFEATSMADLVSASGLSKGAFYYYFPDKTTLFQACVDRFFTACLPESDPVASGAGERGSVAGYLSKLASGYAATLLEARLLCGDASAYLRFVLSVVPMRRGDLLDQAASGKARLSGLYRAEHPEVSSERAESFAEQSLALLEGIGIFAAINNDTDPARRFHDMLAGYLATNG